MFRCCCSPLRRGKECGNGALTPSAGFWLYIHLLFHPFSAPQLGRWANTIQTCAASVKRVFHLYNGLLPNAVWNIGSHADFVRDLSYFVLMRFFPNWWWGETNKAPVLTSWNWHMLSYQPIQVVFRFRWGFRVNWHLKFVQVPIREIFSLALCITQTSFVKYIIYLCGMWNVYNTTTPTSTRGSNKAKVLLYNVASIPSIKC